MAAADYKQPVPPLQDIASPRDPEIIRQLREHSQRRHSELNTKRQQHWDHWREISEWLDPRRGDWLWNYNKAEDRGRKMHGRITNSHGGLAAKVGANGLHSGLTPRSRPWFELESTNPAAKTDRESQEWLHFVQNMLRAVLEGSNFYESVRINYRNLFFYAQGPITTMRDPVDIVRFEAHEIGSYYLGVDARDRTDTFAKEMVLTVGQLLDRYQFKDLSRSVQTAAEKGKYEATSKVLRIIEPNRSPFYEPNGIGWRTARFRQVDFESDGDDQSKVLSIEGRDSFNTAVPKWESVFGEPYGAACPGMGALGDIKGLQAEELNKAEAIEQIPRPSLVAPSSLKGKMDRLVPGETVYADQLEGQGRISRAFELNPQISEIREDIREIEHRIDRHFHRDVFQAITMIERGNVRELEIDARIREQMGQVGPVVEALMQQQNDPVLASTLEVLDSLGLIPAAPPMIVGSPLRVNYVSILAQGQKSADIDRLLRWHAAAAQVAETHPAARHRLDADAWMKEMSTALAVPPATVATDRQVIVAASAEAAALQQQQDAALAEQGSKAVKNVAEAGVRASDIEAAA